MVRLQGQNVRDVDESLAVSCRLAPGQASFHHGWTLHASGSNRSADRRIGVNVQYLAPQMRQTKHDADAAVLVRGVARLHYFGPLAQMLRDRVGFTDGGNVATKWRDGGNAADQHPGGY